MRHLQIISVNHKSFDSKERIGLNLCDADWERLFAFLKFKLGAEGYVLLRTCNRVELYIDAERDLRNEVMKYWISLTQLATERDKDGFETVFGCSESIDYLLRLSAGFESAIYGDDQILSQLKKAFEASRKMESMSTLLERAYQTIMRFHKQICKETNFKSQTVSLAYQALKAAKNELGDESLQNKKVLILGAGDMATQVVKYLPKFRFGSVTIANRTRSRAETLARGKSISVVDFADIHISNYDIVISCIDQGAEMISDWNSIQYYIDLSIYSGQLEDLTIPHVLLNGLQDIINRQNEIRLESVEEVKEILVMKAAEYMEWSLDWKKRKKQVGHDNPRFI